MKNLKGLLSLILILTLSMGLYSCNDPFGTDTDKYAVSLSHKKVSYDYEDTGDEGYQAFLSELSHFSASVSSSLYQSFSTESSSDNENLCFSPLSIYMALALAVECSEGQTRQEILDALGMTYEEVSVYTRLLYALCNRSFKYYCGITETEKISAFEELNNSVWLDDSISVNTENAEKLSKYYNADVFAVPFGNGEADRAIKQYIKDKTHGLIDGELKTEPDTVFALINTFYLKEIWNELGKELDKTEDKHEFENADLSTDKLYLLESKYTVGKAYRAENYQSFYATTENGFKLHFLLPDNGASVSEIFTEENLTQLLSVADYGGIDDENRQIHYTRILFPEFEAEFNENIDGVLREEHGIERLFSPENAELSALSLNSGENLYCSKVVHKTKIKVDEKGIEGAAITAVLGDGAAGPHEYGEVYHDLIINRAFGFVLTDPWGTVLFSGVINQAD